MDWLTAATAAGSVMKGIGSLMGASGDGVSGKALGADRAQWGWKMKQSQEYQRQAMVDAAIFGRAPLEMQYDVWTEKMLPVQDTQIQRRVKDAKSAGLHPLFALGMNPGNMPQFQVDGSGGGAPQVSSGIPGQARSGSHAGDNLMRLGQALTGLQQDRAQLDLTKAQTEYWNSQTKKAEAEIAAGGGVITRPYDPTGTNSMSLLEGQSNNLDVEYVPSQVTRPSPDRDYSVSGNRPAYMPVAYPGMNVYHFAANDIGESIESTPFYMWLKLANDTYNDWEKLNPGQPKPSFTRILSTIVAGSPE